MRVQLWSAHYEPQRSGIAPLVGTMARALRDLGIEVTVVAAHPFYPDPLHWQRRRMPQRTVEDGISVVRLPIYAGRQGVGERVAQEASHAAALTAALPFLGRPDVLVAVSPFFLALIPAMINARARRVPWVLWLQDILPDGATATGMVDEGVAVGLARRLEIAAYRSADRIVVISDSFIENLCQKGVGTDKIVRLYNPATVNFENGESPTPMGDGRTVATMGNIGYSQNLTEVVRAFEADATLAAQGAHLVLAGDGAAAEDVRATVRSDRVRVTGFLDWDELERELQPASLALVSQRYAEDALDFNVPSKLMNFMARGLPVIAVVRSRSEVARIVSTSGCGWVVDCDHLDDLGATIAEALGDRNERRARGQRGQEFAAAEFDPRTLAARYTAILQEVRRPGRRTASAGRAV